MKSKLLAVRSQALEIDVVLLLLRLYCGYAFMLHGWGKIQNPFQWAGPQAGIPGFFQGLAALAEFGGGLSWMLGLLTRLGSFGIACTMVVASCLHLFILGDPAVNTTGGNSAEPAIVYLLVALVLLAMGPGRFSLDRKLFSIAGDSRVAVGTGIDSPPPARTRTGAISASGSCLK